MVPGKVKKGKGSYDNNNKQQPALDLSLSLVKRHSHKSGRGLGLGLGGVACIEQGNSASGVAVMVVLLKVVTAYRKRPLKSLFE